MMSMAIFIAAVIFSLSFINSSFAASYKTHIVEIGDTIGGIAKKYVESREDICGVNRPDVCSKPLQIGQEINLPVYNSANAKELDSIVSNFPGELKGKDDIITDLQIKLKIANANLGWQPWWKWGCIIASVGFVIMVLAWMHEFGARFPRVFSQTYERNIKDIQDKDIHSRMMPTGAQSVPIRTEESTKSSSNSSK